MIRAVGVVVPAHDEQDLLPSCLASLRRAERALRTSRVLRASAAGAPRALAVHLVVVADACRDRTAEVARRGGATVVSIGARNVGMARAAGVREVLRLTGDLDPADVWVATTDADSLVPPGWLVQQVQCASGGWDAVVGTIRVTDWSGYPPGVRTRFLEQYGLERHGPGGEHPHVHGANLGFRAAAYLRAGGFPELPTGEDHALVASLAASGGKVLRTDAVTVVTSARMQARAPDGFRDYLAGLVTPG